MLPASNAGSKTAPSTTYGTTPGALSSGPTTNRKTGDGPTTAGETQCAAVKTQRDVIAVPVHVPDPLLVVEITSPTAGHCGLVCPPMMLVSAYALPAIAARIPAQQRANSAEWIRFMDAPVESNAMAQRAC